MSAAAKTLAGGEWNMAPPEVTRVVAGGPGDLAARAFAQVVYADREREWGTVLEAFKDATSAKTPWADGTDEAFQVAKYFLLDPNVSAADKAAFSAVLRDAAVKSLDEGAATSGLSIELSETRAFRLLGDDGVQLGDPVRAVAEGQPFEAPVTAVTVTLTDKGTVERKAEVGERKDDASRILARAIAALSTSNRRRSTDR